jgi:hypothetical protein
MIATDLWEDSITVISDEMIQKVNCASFYLQSQGFELKGRKLMETVL